MVDVAVQYYNKGVDLVNLGQHAEALTSFDKAIAINPEFAEAWNNRGTTLEKLGRNSDAIASYDKSIAINPDFALPWSNRGVALVNLGRHSEAIASYDKAIAINSEYAEAWNGRGWVLGNLGRHAEALASFDMSIASNPDYDEAWINRRNTLRELSRDSAPVAPSESLDLKDAQHIPQEVKSAVWDSDCSNTMNKIRNLCGKCNGHELPELQDVTMVQSNITTMTPQAITSAIAAARADENKKTEKETFETIIAILEQLNRFKGVGYVVNEDRGDEVIARRKNQLKHAASIVTVIEAVRRAPKGNLPDSSVIDPRIIQISLLGAKMIELYDSQKIAIVNDMLEQQVL